MPRKAITLNLPGFAIKMGRDYVQLRQIVSNERNQNICLSDFKKSLKVAQETIKSRSEIIGYDSAEDKQRLDMIAGELIKDLFQSKTILK